MNVICKGCPTPKLKNLRIIHFVLSPKKENSIFNPTSADKEIHVCGSDKNEGNIRDLVHDFMQRHGTSLKGSFFPQIQVVKEFVEYFCTFLILLLEELIVHELGHNPN